MVRNRAPRVEAANPVFKLAPHPYTKSLDAAIALCERKTETREQFVEVFDKGVDLWLISGDENHRTMPKYAVLALLRALSTEDGK